MVVLAVWKSTLYVMQVKIFATNINFDKLWKQTQAHLHIFCYVGYAPNEPSAWVAMAHFQNVYKVAGWDVDTHFVSTNTPSNTACRAPGKV